MDHDTIQYKKQRNETIAVTAVIMGLMGLFASLGQSCSATSRAIDLRARETILSEDKARPIILRACGEACRPAGLHKSTRHECECK